MVYDRGDGVAAFDNVDVITYGQYGGLFWSGALRLFVNGSNQTVGSCTYDNNGNMTSRTENGVAYTQSWNVDNRLASISTAGTSLTFGYDASNTRVKTVFNGTTTIYIGGLYEKNLSTGEVTKSILLWRPARSHAQRAYPELAAQRPPGQRQHGDRHQRQHGCQQRPTLHAVWQPPLECQRVGFQIYVYRPA